MASRSLFLTFAIAFALLWGTAPGWTAGLAPDKPVRAAHVGSASVAQPAARARATGPYAQECVKARDGELNTAQACPPGTCPCRLGGCLESCC
jgi:hypothetical protein